MKRILGYLSVLLLALAAFTSLSAQTAVNGDLTGTVTDPQGAVVPNAQVELKKAVRGVRNVERQVMKVFGMGTLFSGDDGL